MYVHGVHIYDNNPLCTARRFLKVSYAELFRKGEHYTWAPADPTTSIWHSFKPAD